MNSDNNSLINVVSYASHFSGYGYVYFSACTVLAATGASNGSCSDVMTLLISDCLFLLRRRDYSTKVRITFSLTGK